MPRSDSSDITHDSFLGVKLPSDLKEEAKRKAEERGISVSELVRRRLEGEPNAAEQATA